MYVYSNQQNNKMSLYRNKRDQTPDLMRKSEVMTIDHGCRECVYNFNDLMIKFFKYLIIK